MIPASIIERASANVFECTINDIRSKSQVRHIADARRLTYYLMHQAGMSYREIARHFKRSTHTGILEMVRRARGYMFSDIGFSYKAEQAKLEIYLMAEHNKCRKRRYNAHYRLRKKGYRLFAHNKTILIPYTQADSTIACAEVRLLQKEGYSLQLTWGCPEAGAEKN